jgi:hypothetical protein
VQKGVREIAATQMASIKMEAVLTNLRDTLLVHPSVEHCPCYSARVLALEEKGFSFAILETEDFAVASNVELALHFRDIVSRGHGQRRTAVGILSSTFG